jgi:hypothetical protein
MKPRIPLLLAALLGACIHAQARLPPPTPAQAEAAATKKAAADAAAQHDKEALLASMDTLAGRWRGAAPKHGWKLNPVVPVAAPVAAVGAPATQAAAPPPQPEAKKAAPDVRTR